MSTITLQALVDNMREHPLSAEDPYTYIDVFANPEDNEYSYSEMFDEALLRNSYRAAVDGAHRPAAACAIGEAVLQLNALAHDCVGKLEEEDNSDALTSVLEKCVEGTAISKVFPIDQDNGRCTYTSDEDNKAAVAYTFWRRAEYWYSYSPRSCNEEYNRPEKRTMTRVEAILKAAEEFGLEVH